MRDLAQVDHHPLIEQVVDILCNKTQNTDRGFFRVEVAYFIAKMAASMRATVKTKDRGDIPVNVYALALATSGYGKGHSVSIMENDFLKGFRTRFMEETFPLIADQNLYARAQDRAIANSSDEDVEKASLDREFTTAGALAFTFDSGTPAAVKQMRQKLMLAECGSINLQVDEIGSNLINSTDVLNVFLELYDLGMVKQKLTKNTNENVRGQELDGRTPTNALLFGTPSKLLDGAQTEDYFYSFLDTGYARRCIFAWGEYGQVLDEDPKEVYRRLTQPRNDQVIANIARHFESLAHPDKFNWTVLVDDAVGIELLTYKMQCDRLAMEMAEHEEIRKAEMKHRYFRVLKLAGAMAFIDEMPEITMDTLYHALKLVEESGAAFQKLLTRESAYMKLARFIAAYNGELTHADLHEQLPFYKSGQAARNEQMTLATAWGFKNGIMIKKSFMDGIELYSGEMLKETSLDELVLSYSTGFAADYQPERAPWDKLSMLLQADGLHWANHHFQRNYRSADTALPGFNLLVLDVDGGASLSMVHDLMQEYTFLTQTTKRHSAAEHRFRLLIPINYELQLDREDFRQFMDNVMEWLPFPADEASNQQSKKWLTNPAAQIHANEGQLLDALKFVPKTSKNEHHMQGMQKLQSLDNLERWFAQRIASGNRNNQMIKFALALVDGGMSYPEVEQKVLAFNGKLSNGLTEDEIRNTILVTVAKKIANP